MGAKVSRSRRVDPMAGASLRDRQKAAREKAAAEAAAAAAKGLDEGSETPALPTDLTTYMALPRTDPRLGKKRKGNGGGFAGSQAIDNTDPRIQRPMVDFARFEMFGREAGGGKGSAGSR